MAAMAQTVLNLGLAGKTATDSLQTLTTAIKGVEDLSKSLQGGALSGLPPGQQAASDAGAYQRQLNAVLGAGTAVTAQQLTDLTTLANTAVTSSTTAYGQGPQTAALRRSILGGLGQVQAITGPSTAPLLGAGATPAAQVTAALLASTGVQSAQSGAIVAALHAAGVPGYQFGTTSTASGAVLVGESGPELISQGGGLSVTPIGAHPNYQWSGNGDVVGAVNNMRAEIIALRRVVQSVGTATVQKADTANEYLNSLDNKAGVGASSVPLRQRVSTR
jgi:hypothetical protein